MSQGAEWSAWPSYGLRLGQNLRRLRLMRGLTQERLAELVEVTRNTISNIERNENNSGKATNPSLMMIYRIAHVLDVPPAVLLPAGNQRVDTICPEQSLTLTLMWPATPQDELPFSAEYLRHARPGHPPTYAVTAPREDPGEGEEQEAVTE